MDVENGSNANDGMSSTTAWQTPDVLKIHRMSDNDTLLFHRGMAWYGYTMSFTAQDLRLGNYGSEHSSSALPLLRAASPLDHEHIFNADLDIHTLRSDSQPQFPGWETSGVKGGSVTAASQTRNSKGVCANLVATRDGVIARISNILPNKVATEMPVSYTFWVKVLEGSLNIRISNLVSKKYLTPELGWNSDPVSVASLGGEEYADWKKVSIEFNNDSVGQIKIDFISTGNVFIDDMSFETKWVRHADNVFKRTLITSKGNAVYGVYADDDRLERAETKESIDAVKRWHWDGEEKLFYLYHDDDIRGMGNDGMLVDRSHYKLLGLNGAGQEVDGIAFEKSESGIHVAASGIVVKNCIIRQMVRYSINIVAKTTEHRLNSIRILRNRISDSGNGPYLVRTNDSLVGHNIIYDIGDKGTKTDKEAIPVMIGSNNLIEHNEIYDVLIGIDIWGSRDEKNHSRQSINNVIRYNKIYNAQKYGIVLGGEAFNISTKEEIFGEDCPSKTTRTGCAYRGYVFGNLVHHNLIYSSGNDHAEGSGIRITKTPIKSMNYVFNNTLYDNNYNISGEVMAGGFTLVNNISHMPRVAHLKFPGADIKSGDLRNTNLSHNIFYPGERKSAEGSYAKTAYLFQWGGRRYSDFSRFRQGSGQQAIVGRALDPMLQCVECGDFRPRPGSPAVAQGTRDVGVPHREASVLLERDIDGQPIPAAKLPDIGCYQFGES